MKDEAAMRGRRRLIAATGLIAALLGLGLPGSASAAGTALPQRNLVVEARVVESSVLERQTLAGSGSVIVGTGGNRLPGATVTTRAGSDSQRSDSVQRVLVLNGGRATLRLSQLTPLRSAEWVWAGQGIGVARSTVWVDIGQGLAVRPSWPGGSQPVRAEVTLESAGRSDTPGTLDLARPGAVDARAQRLAVSTELSLPLGEWVSVAQLFDDSGGTAGGVGVGGAGAGAVASTRALRRELSVQLRITAP
jgi:hypothetical protein